MPSCPLPTIERESLIQGSDTLLPKCKAAQCKHCGGEGEPPGGCILRTVKAMDRLKAQIRLACFLIAATAALVAINLVALLRWAQWI